MEGVDYENLVIKEMPDSYDLKGLNINLGTKGVLLRLAHRRPT